MYLPRANWIKLETKAAKQMRGMPFKRVVFIFLNASRKTIPDPAANTDLGKKRISPRIKTKPMT